MTPTDEALYVLTCDTCESASLFRIERRGSKITIRCAACNRTYTDKEIGFSPKRNPYSPSRHTSRTPCSSHVGTRSWGGY